MNDGQSLAMVADGSIDLAFSFDSLVHVEAEVLGSYIAQIKRKLRPNGIAFLHHSNLGEFVEPATGQLQPEIENPYWRALSVSAESVRATCESCGLVCVSQEIVNWGGNVLNDAITVAALRDSRWSGPNVVWRNTEFMREVEYVARIARSYDWGRLGRGAGRGDTGRTS